MNKIFYILLCVISSTVYSQTVYLECVVKENRQTLEINYDNNTVKNFVGDSYKAKITDGSISWNQTYGNSTSTSTLNRFTGIYTSKCLSNCMGSVYPMKCEVKTQKKF